MYAETLRAKLRGVPEDARVVFDFGGVQRGFKQIRKNGVPAIDGETVIECGDSDITVAGLLIVLSNEENYRQIQLFTAGGEDYAYYEVSNVLWFGDTGIVFITAGPVIVANI